VALLADNIIFSMAQTRDGRYMFGTGNGGLSILGPGGWSRVDQVEGRRLGTVLALCVVREGGVERVYAGTDAGLAIGEGGRWRFWKGNDHLPDPGIWDVVRTVDASGDGILWIGTRKGLLRVDRQGIRPVALPGTGERCFVSVLHVTGNGTPDPVLWVGTRGRGVYRWSRDRWMRFGRDQGLGSEWIQALHDLEGPDGRRVLWVGCVEGGACALDVLDPGRVFRTLDTHTTPALPSDVVLQIQSDRQGRVLFFTNRGVLRLGSREATTFTTGDGLPSNGCAQGSSFVDRKGRVWIGTLAGAAFLDPALEWADHVPKPLFIQKAALLPGGADLPEGARLSHRQGLAFNYALLSYFREGDTRYRVQLRGLDREPSPWTREPVKEYPSLPPGDYTFLVWGQDAAGNVSGPAARSFSVKPSPWASGWAFTLYLLAGGIAIFTLHRLRVRILHARNQALQRRVERATREIREHETRLKAQAESLTVVNGELQDLNARLHDINAQKDHFLGLVAHDLRNPLNGIVLNASLLEGEEEPEEVNRIARVIHKEGMDMSSLIGRFLDIAAIDSGTIRAERETFDLDALARHVAGRYQERARDKSIELRIEGQVPLEAYGDPKFTKEALDNLLSNALKFSPRDRTVTVSLEAGQGLARVRVTDQGPGLTAEDRSKLFGRFSRLSARPTGGEKSVGLGLSIVKHLVDAMGGRIQVESEPGRGATFIIELPATPP
jgi:signal transduction histidine kinase